MVLLHSIWLEPLIGATLPEALGALSGTARNVRFGMSFSEERSPQSEKTGNPETRRRVEEEAQRLLRSGVEPRYMTRKIAEALGVSTNCVRDYLAPFLETQKNLSR